MSALRELLAKFTIDVDDKKLESLNKRIDEGVDKLKEFGEIFVGGFLIERVNEFLNSQVELASQLTSTANRLGISTDALQKFNLAANLANVGSDAAATGLQRLNLAMGEAASGDATLSQNFAKLNIHLKDGHGKMRDVLDVAGDLADKVAEAGSAAQQTKIAFDFFGRGGIQLIPLLKRGREAFEESAKAVDDFGGGLTKDFLDSAEKVEEQQKKLAFGWTVIKTRLAQDLFPALNFLLTKFYRGAIVIQNLVRHTNILKTASIALALFGLARVAKKLLDVAGGVKGLIGLFRSFGPIVILATALYLIFDDLFTLMTGGNSVIGQVLDHLYGVGTAAGLVQELTDTWNNFLEALGLTSSETDKALGEKSGGLSFWIESAVDATLFLIDLFETVIQMIGDIASGLRSLFKGDLNNFSDKFIGLGDRVVDGVTKALGDLTEGKIGDKRHGFSRKQLEAGTGSTGIFTQGGQFIQTPSTQASGPVNVTQQNDIKVDVNAPGANHAQTRNAVRQGVQDALGKAGLRSAFAAVGTGT